MSRYCFCYFIAGDPAGYAREIDVIRQVCNTDYHEQYELHVIDVLRNPDAVRRENLLATPVLVQQAPGPQRRIVGNLRNEQQVREGLLLASYELDESLHQGVS
ncbi:MAG: hypothetical protein KDA79_00110 [Planctomycetaceae bacterium]|nr:hypothetical protein [Planctomycetaceae bacterium]